MFKKKAIGLHLSVVLVFLSKFLSISAQLAERDSLLSIYKNPILFNKLKVAEKVDLLNDLSNIYRFRNPDSLKLFADLSIQMNEDSAYSKGYVESMVRLGDYFSDLGENKKASLKYQEAKDLISTVDDPSVHYSLLKSLALHYSFVGDLNKMLKSTYDAIDICRENSFPRREAVLRHNMGWFYSNNALYSEAQNEFLIADSLLTRTGDMELRSSVQSNIAYNALKTKDFDLVKKNAEESLSYFKKTNNYLWQSRSSRIIGNYHLINKDFETALLWAQKSDSLLSFNENPRDLIQISLLYSKIFLSLNDFDKSYEYSTKTQKLANKLKDTSSLLESYTLLKDIVLRQGEIDASLEYFSKYEKLKGNFSINQQDKNLMFLKAKLDFDREKMLAKTKIENEISQKNLLIYISFILVSALAIIVFLVRKNYKNQQKATLSLHESNVAKDKIFEIIGHDLKSPIQTLQEFLELYQDNEITDQEIAKITPRLKTNVDHSAFTLSNLFLWATNQMKGISTNPKPVAIKNHATQVVNLYSEKIEKKGLRVTCLTNPKMKVMVDNDHLDLILRNLILNAIKFTPENGQIQFSGKEVGNTIVFQIKDSGIGITPSQLKSVLYGDSVEPHPGTDNEKGTGIGLQITKELVYLNKGQLELESFPNRGTTVKIILPKA